MAAKLTRLAHKIAIQLHLVAESCTMRSSRSRMPVRKLLDTTSYPPIYALVFHVVILFRYSAQIFVPISQSSHACYTPHPTHAPSFVHSNNIWWRKHHGVHHHV